jgi:hypothetical protein
MLRQPLEEMMNTKNLHLKIAALALGVTVASTAAFAQTPGGPGGIDYGAGSNPQSGMPTSQPAASPTAARTPPLYNAVPQRQRQQQPSNQTLGPAGPGGTNYGAGSNPQTGN